MADQPGNLDDGEDSGTTPLWVKVFGALALVVVLGFVVLLLTGGHRPGRHFGGGSGANASFDVTGRHLPLSDLTLGAQEP